MTFLGVAYLSSGAPLAALIFALRNFPREYWIFSIACAVSFFIDAAVRAGSGGFGAAHVLIGLQAAMFAGVMLVRTRHLLLTTFVLAVGASLAPFVMNDDPHRMVFVSLIAIPALAWSIWHWDHELKWAIGVYIVVAGLLSAWMVQYYPHDPESFNEVFPVYTLARFVSFGLFIHAAYKWREAT